MRIIYIANARIPTEKAHGLQIVDRFRPGACHVQPFESGRREADQEHADQDAEGHVYSLYSHRLSSAPLQ